jgi:hypothetical protein
MRMRGMILEEEEVLEQLVKKKRKNLIIMYRSVKKVIKITSLLSLRTIRTQVELPMALMCLVSSPPNQSIMININGLNCSSKKVRRMQASNRFSSHSHK